LDKRLVLTKGGNLKMYVYCLWWAIADEHQEVYLLHTQKYSEKELGEHYEAAKKVTKSFYSTTAVARKMCELYGYQELPVEASYEIE
jgi:hypothetical protein